MLLIVFVYLMENANIPMKWREQQNTQSGRIFLFVFVADLLLGSPKTCELFVNIRGFQHEIC